MLDASGSGLERPLESTHQAAVGRVPPEFLPTAGWAQRWLAKKRGNE